MTRRKVRKVKDYGGRAGLKRLGRPKKKGRKKARKKTTRKRLPPRRADGRFKKRKTSR